jgi:predicted nuclease with TOPRIM domain
MTDLVQRLRTPWTKPEHTPIEFAEAADRIEALERENAELESKLAKAEHDLFHTNAKLESMTKVKNFVEWGGL